MYLLVDFGSTFTKVVLVDEASGEIVGRSQAPTTAQTDISEGLRQALEYLQREIGHGFVKNAKILACSSAAGGLRMVVIGLVPELTLEAAKQAALGAGARIVGLFAYELNEDDIKRIMELNPDIILFTGGTDGGNKEVVLHNSLQLAASSLQVPVVYAGNKSVAPDVKKILEKHGKTVFVTENVLPELNRINVEPARACIRKIFATMIVRAKGLEKARKIVGEIIMPTPMATLRGAVLLSNGTNRFRGMGDLIVVEVGGATVNVHSVAEEMGIEGEIRLGIPEPKAKRTVEGDLGIRYNALTITEIAGSETVLKNVPRKGNKKVSVDGRIDQEILKKYVQKVTEQPHYVPTDEKEFSLDAALAKTAISIAAQRHAGKITYKWIAGRELRVIHGRDLRQVNKIVGTGGVFAFNPYKYYVLTGVLWSEEKWDSLLPRDAEFWIDTKYVLFAAGLLSVENPDLAYMVLQNSLRIMEEKC